MKLILKLASFTPKNCGPKTQGNAMLISIFLSGIMLSVGIMAARLAVQEVQMSADLFLSEKAYFSAESGVEKSLWKLKREPLAHIEDTNDAEVADANTTVSIRNLVDTTPGNFPDNDFSFPLRSLESQKWRLRKDTQTDVSTTEAPVTGSLKVELDTAGRFFWRFLCQDASGNTQALQTKHPGYKANGSPKKYPQVSSVASLLSQIGTTDDGVDTDFNSWSGVDKNTCYFSIQNVSSGARVFTFSGTTMAPHAAHIHAVGLHDGREKHIRFDYAQKTLGALFDFSFLHSETGL